MSSVWPDRELAWACLSRVRGGGARDEAGCDARGHGCADGEGVGERAVEGQRVYGGLRQGVGQGR